MTVQDFSWGYALQADTRFTPSNVVSLMNMLSLDPNSLLPPMTYIASAISEWRLVLQLEGKIVPRPISEEKRVGFLKSADMLREIATALEMPTTLRVIDGGFDDALSHLALRRPLSSQEFQRLVTFGEMVLNVFISEANSRAFMALAPGHAAYISATSPLFGEEVDDAFPAASMEISDAGRCRAAGLWTACVMHLMRAAEEPLNALAEWAGLDVGQNWNTILNQIDSRLRERNKASHGADEEQWASEASAHLRAIKNAWRNHAAHGQARYNESEAVAIWNNVQSFMQTLAKKLSR